MESVILGHEGRVDQFPDLLRRGRDFHLVQVIEGFAGSHVMSGGANATDLGRDSRQLLGHAIFTELLEAPELRNLDKGLVDVSIVIEEDLDLPVTFQSCDRVDCDPPCHPIDSFSAETMAGCTCRTDPPDRR